MGKVRRIDFFLDNHIGIGIRWETYNYSFDINISIFFLTIIIGIGKRLESITKDKDSSFVN